MKYSKQRARLWSTPLSRFDICTFVHTSTTNVAHGFGLEEHASKKNMLHMKRRNS